MRISAFFGGGVLCGIAKMNSSHQSSPVSPILESTAQPAINSKIKLILKDYPVASILSFFILYLTTINKKKEAFDGSTNRFKI